MPDIEIKEKDVVTIGSNNAVKTETFLEITKITQEGNVYDRPIIYNAQIRGADALIGSGNSILGFNQVDGFWIGNALFASAPFRVTIAGAVIGTSFTLTGGTITGGTIQTAASGQRIVMTSNTLKGYDASENETITLLGSGTDYGFITIQPTGSSLAGLSIFQTGSGHRGILLIDNSSSGDFANKVLFYASRGALGAHTNTSPLLECYNNVGTGTGFYFENQAVSKGFYLVSGTATANPMLQVDYLDTDKTGVFIRNNTSASPTNNGLFEVNQTVTGFNAGLFNISNAASTSATLSLLHSNASGFAIIFAGGAQDTTAGGNTQTDRILVKNAAGNTRYLYLFSD